MELQDYISRVKTKLNRSSVVYAVVIVDERTLVNWGYFRARLTLKNDDFLEIAESFTIIEGRFFTLGYRYQWMDETKEKLRKRWDNVKHFPDLPNFPHHVHIIKESNVEPSESRNILELMDLIEKELNIILSE
ncbi:toxin-antitoxin system TumE family protein [Nostoc sp.]|uniref:toxin-antitoxin system TumE family protein n=1 Tax=Nostoc sp. TaxID=1180 RepID=UPI002FF9A4CA